MLKKTEKNNILYFNLKIYMNDLKYPDKQGNQRDIRFNIDESVLDKEYFTRIYSDREFVVFKLR